ncbi:PAS domain S-box protein [Azospirillum rugosum]|uniref:histidine kinase n=1 Tax=Azospirillum rugosum TaxID=416170 RepID=A0ABS4SFZ3_9PROT|nr:PAS domain S-box protein [Azospirillum rugosum]MBP2291467.1 PAS domain S-box-containing protein [Azospirillum rugosum]MDQ0525255.1 PAS domain S-box-containing protein [Azospirillum rugosum]
MMSAQTLDVDDRPDGTLSPQPPDPPDRTYPDRTPPARTSAPPPKPRRWCGVVALLPLLVVLLGAAFIGAGVWVTCDSLERERADIVQAKEADAANLVRAFDENIRQTIRRIDQALVHLRDEFAMHPDVFLAKAANWQKTLYADLAFQVSAIDAEGKLLFSNLAPAKERIDLGDREHFLVHRHSADDRLFISRPVLGRVSGRWSIQFTRRIDAPDGSFGGVMVLSVFPDDLTRFYGTSELGQQGSIMLVGMDRVVRARASAAPAPSIGVGAVLVNRPYLDPGLPPSGTLYLTSEVDGIRRIVAYRRLKDYPLVAIVGLGWNEALADFMERRDKVLFGTTLVAVAGMVAILLIAWLIRSQFRHHRRLEATQELLASTEERWRLALEAVGDGVWDWDARSNSVFFSRGWKAMLGYREDEVSDRLEEWEQRVHPDDLAAVHADLKRHLSGETAFYVNEHRVRCKDGGYKWILDRGIVVGRGPDGAALRVVGTHTDITGHKHAEQALRERQELFEQIFVANSAIKLLIDPSDGSIVDANPAAADFYGHSLDRLRSMRVADLNVWSADDIRAEMERAAREERSYFHFRHRLASGAIRDVEVYSSPIAVNGRRLLLSLIHDITERRLAEAELSAKTAELERSNAELEAFAYVASHDLRQPLRTINSYLALVQRDLAGKLDADTGECMEFVRQGAQRMDRLIVDLLEYSRVGRKTRPFALHAAGTIVATARDNLEAAIFEAGAVVEIAPDLPPLWGDDVELTRLFQNLIGNAVKYRSSERRPVIRLGCTGEAAGWHFTVEDNGIGIAPEHFERIFGIFQRLHSADEYDGTGVGLAICKKIVEHHGGRIWVESELGEGSRFHLILPRHTAAAA